jgi:crotonobetainyl-CoA:carnitine CoA-transferase CaiB-like acyl-CoA transferase
VAELSAREAELQAELDRVSTRLAKALLRQAQAREERDAFESGSGDAREALDARRASLAEAEAAHAAEAAAVAGWAATQDKHAAAALLQSLGVAAAAVHDGGDGARSPYLAARGWFTELVHGDIGPTVQEGLPMALSRTPGSNRFAAPCLGQHTHAILRGLAGLDEAAIAALDAAGATSATPG